MACYDYYILFFIMLHSTTIPSTDANASSVTIGLVKYDTDWPHCDFINRCDPFFQICLNGTCITTSHANNTNHIDFSKTRFTPNPVVFNESIAQTSFDRNIRVYDYSLFRNHIMMTLNSTIRLADVCKTLKFEKTMNGQHNTRLQISVSVQGQCLSVPTTSTTQSTTDKDLTTAQTTITDLTTAQTTITDLTTAQTDLTTAQTTITDTTTSRWWTHPATTTITTLSSTSGRWWTNAKTTDTTISTSTYIRWWTSIFPTSSTPTTPLYTSYENYVDVNCQESNWYIRLNTRPLKQQFQDFNARDVYLGRDSCTGYESGDYIIFSEEYNSCLTDKATSSDAVIYTNTLVYALHDPDHRFIIRDYKFKVKVECDMSKREHGVDTIKHNHGHEDHTAAGTGHFSIHLNFYSDSNYQNRFNGFPPAYVVGDVVYVKVQTSMHDYDIKMRLSDCYTKPSEHASTIYTYYLIQNGCPVDRNTFVTSQSTHETRFHFQDFEYAGHPDSMFVHCNATFCKSNDYSSECEPQCKHSKRIGHHRSAVQNFNGPIEISDVESKILFTDKRDSTAKGYRRNSDSSNESSSKFKPLYVAGVIIIAVAMICVLVALSIYFRRKKIRNTSRIV